LGWPTWRQGSLDCPTHLCERYGSRCRFRFAWFLSAHGGTGDCLFSFGLGLAYRLFVRLPTIAGVGLVGLFAVFHGYAHGLELPQAASPILYGLGFVLATTLLHGLGIGFAHSSRQYKIMQRIAGCSLIAASSFTAGSSIVDLLPLLRRKTAMCLAIPMQITHIDGFNAHCAAKGVKRDVSLFFVAR